MSAHEPLHDAIARLGEMSRSEAARLETRLRKERKVLGRAVFACGERLSELNADAKATKAANREKTQREQAAAATRKAQCVGPECPKCGERSRVMRGRSVADHLDPDAWYWACRPSFDCRVSCFEGTQTAMGTLADEATRQARRLAHVQFDALLADGHFSDRGAAYTWLANMLGMDEQDAHMARFDAVQCGQVMALCRRHRAAVQVVMRAASEVAA